jgi:DNA-binding CsgD family transcriptional regulator
MERIADLYRKRWAPADIAAECKISIKTLYKYATLIRKSGVHLAYAMPGSKRRLHYPTVIALVRQGLPTAEIARRLGISPSGVRYVREMYREIGEPGIPPRMQHAPKTRWTPERTALAREVMERDGLKAAALAVGTTAKAVCEHLRRERIR